MSETEVSATEELTLFEIPFTRAGYNFDDVDVASAFRR
jgi:hypothetical protein